MPTPTEIPKPDELTVRHDVYGTGSTLAEAAEDACENAKALGFKRIVGSTMDVQHIKHTEHPLTDGDVEIELTVTVAIRCIATIEVKL